MILRQHFAMPHRLVSFKFMDTSNLPASALLAVGNTTGKTSIHHGMCVCVCDLFIFFDRVLLCSYSDLERVILLPLDC